MGPSSLFYTSPMETFSKQGGVYQNQALNNIVASTPVVPATGYTVDDFMQLLNNITQYPDYGLFVNQWKHLMNNMNIEDKIRLGMMGYTDPWDERSWSTWYNRTNQSATEPYGFLNQGPEGFTAQLAKQNIGGSSPPSTPRPPPASGTTPPPTTTSPAPIPGIPSSTKTFNTTFTPNTGVNYNQQPTSSSSNFNYNQFQPKPDLNTNNTTMRYAMGKKNYYEV